MKIYFPWIIHITAFCCLAMTFAFLSFLTLPALAAEQASLTLTASPDIILADGKSDTMITASVWDSSGDPAPDGTMVQFSASAGILTQDTASTLAGVARVRLISTNEEGKATINATAFLGSSGGAVGSTQIEFTKDKEVVEMGQDARWVTIGCPQYLVYSASQNVIEADGIHGSAHLTYRAFSVTADSLQYNLHTQVLLAQNAVVKSGHHTLTASFLLYHLDTGLGTAVAQTGPNLTQSVNISGLDLKTVPQSSDVATYSTDVNIYQFADLYGSPIVLSARSISIDPGKSLQFQRATIYAYGRKTISMPYDIMTEGSSQPLGQQAVGINSDGLALNVPYYYHVAPSSIGAIYFRDSVDQSGDGIGSLDTSGTRPGFAIDLKHTYSLGMNGSGEFLINSMTRSDWGAQWDDTQRFDNQTHGYFLLDTPDHHSVYASSNLTHQFTGFSLTTTASGNNNPGLNGYSSTSSSLDTSLDSNPRKLGHSGINLVSSLAWQLGQYRQTTPGAATEENPVSTQTVSMRFFTQPIHGSQGTDLTDAITVGQSWGSGRSSPTMLVNLGLNHDAPLKGKLSLDYTWDYDPLYSQLGAEPAGGLLGTFYSASQQRISLNFAAQPNRHFIMSLSGGYGLPFGDSDLYSNLTYQINPLWGVGMGEFFDRYLGDDYQELEFSVSRMIFGRNFSLIYSTLTKKVTFNFIGTSF